MSAYIVDPEDINTLVSAMIDAHMSYLNGSKRVNVTRANAAKVGRILLKENVRSVSYRYGGRLDDEEKKAATSYRFSYIERPLSPEHLIAVVNCLDYQSCETEDWPTTVAYRICQEILANATARLGNSKVVAGLR